MRLHFATPFKRFRDGEKIAHIAIKLPSGDFGDIFVFFAQFGALFSHFGSHWRRFGKIRRDVGAPWCGFGAICRKGFFLTAGFFCAMFKYRIGETWPGE